MSGFLCDLDQISTPTKKNQTEIFIFWIRSQLTDLNLCVSMTNIIKIRELLVSMASTEGSHRFVCGLSESLKLAFFIFTLSVSVGSFKLTLLDDNFY